MRPGVAPMVEAIERKCHAEHIFLRTVAWGQRMLFHPMVVCLAFPAVETIRALPGLEFAGEHVPANAIARRQILEIGMPLDVLDVLTAKVPARAKDGLRHRNQNDRQYGKECAQKDNVSNHVRYLPAIAGSSTCLAGLICNSRSSGNNWRYRKEKE